MLVSLQAKESDFLGGKGPLYRQKKNALLEKVTNWKCRILICYA